MNCNFNTVKTIIDQWDPMCLLHMAPSDEYDVEVNKIIKFIDNSDSIDTAKLATEIEKIFSTAFEDIFKKNYNDCLEISKRILEIEKLL